MKIVSLTVTGLVFVFLATSVGGQDKPPPRGGKSTSSKPPSQDMQQSHSPPRGLGPAGASGGGWVVQSAGGPALPATDSGIGICLIGDQYEYFTDPVETDKCDAVMWVDTITWLINQRKLIDESTLIGSDSTDDEGAALCRSCSGTCQIVSLPITDSIYEDVETDGGQSPGDCLATIKAICMSGTFRYFANARCGN